MFSGSVAVHDGVAGGVPLDGVVVAAAFGAARDFPQYRDPRVAGHWGPPVSLDGEQD